MTKLSDIRGDDALDVLADILDPATEIMTDNEVVMMARAGENIRAVSTAIKNHKKAVIRILAILDGEDPKEYKPPLMAIPIKLLEIFNDPDMVQVFSLQGQTADEKLSGSAMENTEGTETI